jgi:RNA polymerase sigma-70 factor (ECF subfamily)
MTGSQAPYQDPEAFRQLYDHTHLVIFRFIYGLHGGPQQEVEDLTADTFLRAWKARQRFSGTEQAAIAWLIRIARNLVIDLHRRKKSRGSEQQFDDIYQAAPEASPEDQLAFRQQLEVAWNLLQTLPDEQREIIVLRFMLDWPVNRIAEHLGILENTVSVTMRRSLIRMRKQMQVEVKINE